MNTVYPTHEQMTAIKAAIQNAQTIEEVRQLEHALGRGAVIQVNFINKKFHSKFNNF